MKYPIVFWDSGGTIFRRGAEIEAVPGCPHPREVRERRALRVARFLEAYGHRSPADVAGLIAELESSLRPRQGALYSIETLAGALYERLGLGRRPEETLLLADALAGPRYRGWLYDGVAGAMEALSGAGVRMGVIANTEWTGRMMSRALAGVGLAGYLGPVICSCDLGVAKPDPRIFAAALAALQPGGAEPGRALYVGDRVANDIEGPVACGWGAALHLTEQADPPGQAVLAFTDYRELVSLVLGR